MKKIMFIALLSGSFHFPGSAQSSANVAGRFRELINIEQPGWNQTINFSSTSNKTIMKKTIILSIMTTLVMSAAIAQNNTADEQSLRNIPTTLENGWNNKSGETFSSVFADVHDYIVVNGYYFPGFTKEHNAKQHQMLFDGIYKSVDIKLKVDKISFIRSDLAMLHILGASYGKGGAIPKDPEIIMTVLAEKKNDSWKIISFHNHTLESFKDRERSPMPLEVMYASWYKK